MEDIKVTRMFILNKDSKIKAFLDISIGDFGVRGLRVVEGKNGRFVGMPQEKDNEGKNRDVFFPLSEESRDKIYEVVMKAYKEKVGG